MKQNRKGIELSINVIIIMVLALLVLGVVLSILMTTSKRVLNDIKSFPQLEIIPTYEDPIQFIPSAIERGKSNKMTIGFYNKETRDITKNILPTITCNSIKVKVESIGLDIPIGETGTYVALVSVPRSTIPDIYPCNLRISKTEKSFFMEVK